MFPTMLPLWFAALVSLPGATGPTPQDASPERAWTILFYGATDNDAEHSFVPDMGDLAARYGAGDAMELLFLVDRSPRYSDEAGFFGEDFEDTRLYRWDGERAVRVAGGAAFPEIGIDSTFEANTGDAATLRKALRFAKETYPARHTGLVIYSHGGGDSLCPDEASGGDQLRTSEISDVLSADESVDLFVLDVCSMGAVENAYQWRPGNGRFSADVLVATPNAGLPFPWAAVFDRIGARGDLGPLEFGRIVVEESKKHAEIGLEQYADHAEIVELISGEAMACLDLAKAASVKEAVDRLARALATSDAKEVAEEIRGEANDPQTLDYFVPGEPSWVGLPAFDLYDLARRFAADDRLAEPVREAARALMGEVDAMVVTSYGFDRYPEFEPGRGGLYILFPDGDATYGGRTVWDRFGWYHPNPVEGRDPGNLAFCRDGAIPGNGTVEGWYELLDAWYDVDNAEGGGVNGYRW